METLSEIVAQMRGRGEDGRMDRRLWLDYADRIEAAWKREREADTNSNQNGNAAACTDCMTIDDAISHAEEVANASDTPCARQHRQLADWLLELKRLRKSNDKRCNAAAMREALEGMCKASQEVFCSFARETFYGEHRLDSLGGAFDKAKAALSAPARNCDVMSRSICTKHFSTTYEGNRDGLCDVQTEREKNIHLYYMELIDWLFAPAAERKGDGDGR